MDEPLTRPPPKNGVEMRLISAVACAVAALIVAGSPAAAVALDVVTTTEGLASLVREVGGNRVSVTSLSRGTQDPHFVDASPAVAVKIRRAQLLVDVGLDLEVGWLPGLVNVSRNADVQPGGKGRLTAATAVQVVEAPTGPVDRSQGDIHPGGNPHFLSDPRRAEQVAQAIAAKLSQLDPAGAAQYEAQLSAFDKKLAAARRGWEEKLAPIRGRAVITHHRTLSYFLDWAGLTVAGYLEPKPGTPPPPSHIAELVGIAKARGVKAILVENYYDQRPAEVLAKHSGARVLSIPGDVGGAPEAKDWFSWVDLLVTRIVEANR
ncbi:MAG TPA: metal ABC transporter substrate-binding protein [Anaeromyxobacteraceae bacterium]|nr:metal ABC transporter substrate-binding protein [Anaeromyxobacteraceae bacterium]